MAVPWDTAVVFTVSDVIFEQETLIETDGKKKLRRTQNAFVMLLVDTDIIDRDAAGCHTLSHSWSPDRGPADPGSRRHLECTGAQDPPGSVYLILAKQVAGSASVQPGFSEATIVVGSPPGRTEKHKIATGTSQPQITRIKDRSSRMS